VGRPEKHQNPLSSAVNPDENIARQKTSRPNAQRGLAFLREASMRRGLIAIMAIATVALFASEASAKGFPIKKVSKESLDGSCKAAGGTSWGGGSGYGCDVRNCDGKGGYCGVHCNKSGCYGHTPVVAPKGRTVGGVLGNQGATATRNPPAGSRVANPTQTLQPKSAKKTVQPTSEKKTAQSEKKTPKAQSFSGADRGPRNEGRGGRR
jgi:hypothetical protein